MKIFTDRNGEFKEGDKVYLELETTIPNNKTRITIEKLFTGNLQITKTSDIGTEAILIIPRTSNQIQIMGD